MKSPVIYIFFNRPELTQRTFRALRRQQPARLHLIADGPRSDRPDDVALCQETRAIVEDLLDWPCEVTRDYSNYNLGCGRRLYRALDHAVAQQLRKRNFRAVYAYEDGAAFSFREARQRGVATLYDLPIGHWRAARTLLLDEAEREPEWAATLSGNYDSPAKTDRKDAELAQADVVFVASSYTRQTLSAAADFKGTVIVVPYGAPAFTPATFAPAPSHAGKLRVLFVGSLGQRKGLSYLFAACRQLGSAVTLTVIGRKPTVTCAVLERELARVRWIPTCPHQGILAEMLAHDVFVFPSLFEGFGLVLLEAMAMGLPVITTPNTAGPDLIREGIDGFIVPIRDSQAIARHLERLHHEPALLAEMRVRARERAQEFSWENYETTLVTCVSQALAKTKPRII